MIEHGRAREDMRSRYTRDGIQRYCARGLTTTARHMMSAGRHLATSFAATLLFLGAFLGGSHAWAGNGSVYAITCPACATAADFVAAAKQQAWNWSNGARLCNSPPSLYSGLYVVSSQTKPLSALINVKGYRSSLHWYGNMCAWGLSITSALGTRMDGTTAGYSDADLQYSEVGLFGNSRELTDLMKPITMDETQGGYSPIGDEVLVDHVSHGVDYALSQRNQFYNAIVPLLAVLQVTWPDGCTAWVTHVAKSGIMWTIVPFSLRNKAGKQIDFNGNVIPNPHPVPGTPTGASIVEPIMPGYLSPYVVFTPDPVPSGTVTVTFPDGSQTQNGIILPPGG